eukprot:6198059-Pleurochrysis_carterae.AAC.5
MPANPIHGRRDLEGDLERGQGSCYWNILEYERTAFEEPHSLLTLIKDIIIKNKERGGALCICLCSRICQVIYRDSENCS